jgi:hypothetical protein
VAAIAPHRTDRRVALALAVAVALAVVLPYGHRAWFASGSAAAAPVIGPASWPFQGDARVAAADESDAARSFSGAVGGFVGAMRAAGRVAVHVGTPHPVFASVYHLRVLDVVVMVAPVTGGGPVVGLAGLYASDRRHHGIDAVMQLVSSDQEISGNIRSYEYGDEDDVTVVVGGPRAGGLLVEDGGGSEPVDALPGAQTQFDRRGITWMYAAITPTLALPKNGVMTVTDGNGNIQDVLYYGWPSATETSR